MMLGAWYNAHDFENLKRLCQRRLNMHLSFFERYVLMGKGGCL